MVHCLANLAAGCQPPDQRPAVCPVPVPAWSPSHRAESTTTVSHLAEVRTTDHGDGRRDDDGRDVPQQQAHQPRVSDQHREDRGSDDGSLDLPHCVDESVVVRVKHVRGFDGGDDGEGGSEEGEGAALGAARASGRRAWCVCVAVWVKCKGRLHASQ